MSVKDSVNQSLPPQQVLMDLLLGVPVTQIIAVAARMGIPGRLRNGPTSVTVVAQESGTLEDPTYRLLRALSAIGITTESADRKFSLTPVGECLLPEVPGSFDALAKLNGSAWWISAFSELTHTLQTDRSAFSKQAGDSLFGFLAEHPSEQELFARAMSTFSGAEVALILSAFDFSKYRHIVDVGGGHGMLLAAVLKSATQAQGTLLDRPGVVPGAEKRLREAGLVERSRVVAGDFFEGVPTGGDVYLLKHILHDWDDARAVRILRSVAQAMAPGGRVLVIEQGITPPGVPGPGKIADIVMMVLTEGGRERSVEELRALFERAGLRFEREITTPGAITLFEALRT